MRPSAGPPPLKRLSVTPAPASVRPAATPSAAPALSPSAAAEASADRESIPELDEELEVLGENDLPSPTSAPLDRVEELTTAE
jgi:hypothetical protein